MLNKKLLVLPKLIQIGTFGEAKVNVNIILLRYLQFQGSILHRGKNKWAVAILNKRSLNLITIGEFIILLSIWFKIVLILFISYKVINLLLFLKIIILEKYYKLMFKEKKTKNPIYDLYTHSLIPN